MNGKKWRESRIEVGTSPITVMSFTTHLQPIYSSDHHPRRQSRKYISLASPTSVKYQFSFKVSHSFKVAAADGFQKNIITNLNKYIKL